MHHELGENRVLAIAKPGFAFELEDDGNRDAEPPLQLDVGVVEGLVEAPREQSPERRLAASRHAHQKQVAPMQMHRGILVERAERREPPGEGPR